MFLAVLILALYLALVGVRVKYGTLDWVCSNCLRFQFYLLTATIALWSL